MKRIIMWCLVSCNIVLANNQILYKDTIFIDRYAKIMFEKLIITNYEENAIGTTKSSGRVGHWSHGEYYCKQLKKLGLDDWRIPTIEELKYIHIVYKNNPYHLSWSNTWAKEKGKTSKYNYLFNLKDGSSSQLYNYGNSRAVICIRGIKYSNLSEINQAVNKNKNIILDNEKNIYNLIFKKNNIVGYKLFIKKYPNAFQVKKAIQQIHKLAYKKAKSLHTLSAYNTFIISYPYAKEVKNALFLSEKIESGKYHSMKKDDEKKARLLAVKIKKITLRMKRAKNKDGYYLVKNRMINLLTEKYEETDASLRYYESKEFLDFSEQFRDTMSDIKYVLNNINDNTSKILSTTKQGFEDEKADRKLSEWNTQQYRNWNKLNECKKQNGNSIFCF